jgi:hypothetical protein
MQFNSYDDISRQFKAYPQWDRDRQESFLERTFKNKYFYRFLYDPRNDGNIGETIERFYSAITHPIVLKGIIGFVEDNGVEDYGGRSLIVFLNTLKNIVVADINNRASTLHKSADDLSVDKIEKDAELIKKLNKRVKNLEDLLKDLLKKKVKSLVEDTNIPKYICQDGFTIVPDPEFIAKYRIGTHLSNLLAKVYSDASVKGSDSPIPHNPKWKAYFKTLFGKENLEDCATIILLEGVSRIDSYRNSKPVSDVWDTLTTFALKTIEESDNDTIEKSLDFYIKRIDRMFKNNAYDLRVDLLKLNRNEYPKLWKAVDRKYDIIKNIVHQDSGKRIPASPSEHTMHNKVADILESIETVVAELEDEEDEI